MENLRSILSRAKAGHWATGHFNVSELDQMKAIVLACKEVGAPAIIGLSEGERKHMGLREAVALRDVLRQEFDIPVFLNADHTKSVALAKEAIDAGFDSVHIDLSAENFEANVAGTKEVVDLARNKSDVNIEGELGYLRGESKIQKEKIKIEKEDYTNPEEAKKFVELTGVDRLAIAVGNIHGISQDEPNLDIDLIKNINEAVGDKSFLVLHAGSGIPDNQIKLAIESGIVNIHINTDIRVTYAGELKKSLSEQPGEVAMYKLDQSALDALKKAVMTKLALFGCLGRIVA